MRKIRIGNDIQVSWEVRTGGEAVSLEGRSLRVWVRSAYSRQEVESFSVEGCVLTFTYPAEMQKTTGARAVVLEDMTEGSARRTLCADEAFTLVAHTSEEDCSCGCGDGVGNAAAQGEDFDKYLVALKSNIIVGKPGLSAYDLWLKDGHTGTMEDYMRWLQQPAADAASSVTEAEKKRVEAESGRSEAERLRDEAEAERNTNEGKRKTAETERQTAFSDGMKKLGDKEQEVDTAVGEMKTAVGNAIAEATNKTDEAVRRVTETEDSVKRTEALRVNEENKRTAAETGRIDAESERQTAESGRAKAESQRQSAETARNAAEGSRIKSEKERIKSEELRAADESDRQTAERQRQTAEQSRTTAEADRTKAETKRTEAERQRQTAEQERADTFQQQTETVDTALKNCETATEGAEKVNAALNGTVLTVTNRDGEKTAQDVRGPKGDTGSTGPQGERGVQGEKGDKGDAMTYTDLTEEQKDELRKPARDAAEELNGYLDIVKLPVVNTEAEGTAVSMDANKVYNIAIGSELTLTLNEAKDLAVTNEWQGNFDTGAEAPSVTWPQDVVWTDKPSVEANRHYEFSIRLCKGRYYGILYGWNIEEAEA